jgi:hypothetical protein
VYRLLIFALSACVVCSAGCSYFQTTKDTWKFTKRQYYSYINTPASLDLTDTGSATPYQQALGECIAKVDENLKQFSRTMENSDLSPSPQWVIETMTTYPWLSGFALLNAEGNVEARYPDYDLREFDPSSLIEPDTKQMMLDLRTMVQKTPQGVEIYVGKPVYINGEFRGMVVAHFDPRNLVLASSPQAEKIAIISTHGEIFSGSSSAAGALGAANWEELVLNRSYGYVGSSDEYFWLTRYLGNLPVVYLVATSAEPVTLPALDENASDKSATAPAYTPLEIPETEE